MKLLALGLFLAIALAAQVGYFAGPAADPAPAPTSAAAASASDQAAVEEDPGLPKLPAELVATIGERPLLTPSRTAPTEPPKPEKKPEKKPEPKKEKPPKPLQATLRAVVRNGKGGWILLQRQGEGKGKDEVVRVDRGQRIAGWTLDAISSGSATFTQDGRRQELKLRDFD